MTPSFPLLQLTAETSFFLAHFPFLFNLWFWMNSSFDLWNFLLLLPRLFLMVLDLQYRSGSSFHIASRPNSYLLQWIFIEGDSVLSVWSTMHPEKVAGCVFGNARWVEDLRTPWAPVAHLGVRIGIVRLAYFPLHSRQREEIFLLFGEV